MTRRFWLRLVAGLVVLAITEAGWTCWRIVHQSTVQELRPASAIVVFGAAEYSGRPSPVYRARLDHAFDLYSQHLAPWVITYRRLGRGTPASAKAALARNTCCIEAFPKPADSRNPGDRYR